MWRPLRPEIQQWRRYAVAGALLMSALCRAETGCPWLNRATAAGVLRGPVSLEVSNGAEAGGVCIFRRQETASSLKIVVHGAAAAAGSALPFRSQCTSSIASLRGIGNEAVLCAVGSRKVRGEQVIGRVRDRLFVVDLRMKREAGQPPGRESLQGEAERISEQVAGALF